MKLKKKTDRKSNYRNVGVYSGWQYFSLSTDMKINYLKEKEIKKMTGTTKWFNAQRGYGFITESEGLWLYF